jgi:transglutaminase-like putative cysteine protease
MKRDVTARIVLTVTEPAHLVFAIAVAQQHLPADEAFTALLDGTPVEVEEVADAHGTRLHRIHSQVGELVVDYRASVDGDSEAPTTSDSDLLVYTRPSRYSESDSLAATAGAEFLGIQGPEELLGSVSSWVGTRLAYVSGSSLPTDGAVRTLLNRQGVCRDYAHLSVAFLRALGIPARLAAVYAPGLSPMDFHAVAEAWVDGRWCVVDATTLAPRQTLVRIATGRDAADTAFLNVLSGRADLREVTVSAVAETLPNDDITQLVSIS